MGRISIQEISKVLIERYQLGSLESEGFANAIFNVIRTGLDNDGFVKVKGLGTFKIIGVDARESVNVNTGERVVIESHGKITFTPDSTMKELVNKPFSQFDTVILGEDIEIVNIDENVQEADEVKKKDDGDSVINENNTEVFLDSKIDDIENDEVEDKKQNVAGPMECKSSLLSSQINSETKGELDSQNMTDDNINSIMLSTKKDNKIVFFIISAIACCAFAYGGYRYGIYDSTPNVQTPKFSVAKKANINIKKKITKVEKKEISDVSEVAFKKDTLQKKENTVLDNIQISNYDQYEAKDHRVRTGAYRIIGTDHVRTVKAGETLTGISRVTLGDGMVCYIEVYNDLEQNAKIKEGQKIKIPKLELKKKRK